jgi:hypothetical protein
MSEDQILLVLANSWAYACNSLVFPFRKIFTTDESSTVTLPPDENKKNVEGI